MSPPASRLSLRWPRSCQPTAVALFLAEGRALTFNEDKAFTVFAIAKGRMTPGISATRRRRAPEPRASVLSVQFSGGHDTGDHPCREFGLAARHQRLSIAF